MQTITDPAGLVTEFTQYDANGNNTEMRIKEPDGTVRKTVVMTYDARSRLRSSTVTTNDSALPPITMTYGYDANDNRTAVTDPETRITRYSYNEKRKLIKITNAEGKDTNLAYGATGCPSCGGGGDKLTAVTDAKNQTTSYQYDVLGRLQYETDPLGKKYRYTYYANGKVKEKYDATDSEQENVVVSYSYSPTGQLTGRQYADGMTEAYTYDANDRLLTASSTITLEFGTETFGYAYEYYPNGRLKSISDNNGTVVSYDQYDLLGQRKQMTVKAGAVTNSFSYDYDTNNRPWKITSNAGTFEYLYDELGRRDTLTYPNGVIADYYYDDLDRLTSLTHATSASTITFADYTDFDKTGNRKSKSTAKGTEMYNYDSLYRLTDVSGPKPEAFTYDDVGNRTKGPGAKDSAYSYNAANQMTQGRKLGYQYDNAGNQITRTVPGATDKSWNLTWNLDNRLVKMEKTKGYNEKETINFRYDPFGRRIEKKQTVVSGNITTTLSWRYVYDNDNIVLESDNSGSVGEMTWYTHGPDTDEHLAMERIGHNNFYFHQDGLGSVTAITDSSKKVVQTYEYDSFGMGKPSTPFRNSYQFAGRPWDQEMGLYYNDNRYYDPIEGRFVSKDPIGFAGGLNVYGYVQNNSINFTDPFGLLAQCRTGLDSLLGFQIGPAHHEYQCWTDSSGETTCRGFGRDPNSNIVDALTGTVAGKIIKDSENVSHGKSTCTTDDKNKCMDQCAESAWQRLENTQLFYSVKYGADCQTVQQGIYAYCKQECSK